MTTSREQSAARHARYAPLYHYVALPVTSIAAIVATVRAVREPDLASAGWALWAWGVVAALVASRVMALTVQDRVIRLEETLRLQRLLPAERLAEIGRLRRRHFVALRFASDEELPELVGRVSAGELTESKAIKAAIRTWRADWLRA